MRSTGVVAAARDLLADLERRPWGQVTPSIYETARVVALAPWLRGHRERVEFLVDAQRADGGWGRADGYELVPTLSAAEALAGTAGTGGPRVAAAADRALGLLNRALTGPRRRPLPDTAAMEIIIPALVAALNRHLDRLRHSPVPGLAADRYARRLQLPPGTSDEPLARLRGLLAAGATVPEKLHHSLEVLAPLPAHARLRPAARLPAAWTIAGRAEADGEAALGASPAATAAWLAMREPAERDPAAVRYLTTLAGQYGGPVPSVVPITAFERAWVLTTLDEAGVAVPRPAALRIARALLPAASGAGIAGGAGLPADCDTTSVALLALSRLGLPVDVDVLYAYAEEDHFCTWLGERTASVTTNGHVLATLGRIVRTRQPGAGRHRGAVAQVTAWLCEQQHDDGHWTDKWHASPLYATSVAAVALYRYGGLMGRRAAGRAVQWLLANEWAGGGWGRWEPTAEETAYAVQILATTGGGAPALVRGGAYLDRVADAGPGPALWHDKDLYQPAVVVAASVLAARHLVAVQTTAPAAGRRLAQVR